MILLLLVCIGLLTAVTADINVSGTDTIISIELGDYQVNKVGNFTEISLNKAQSLIESGVPDLPFLNYHISTPVGYSGEARVNIIESINIKLDEPIKPVPQISRDGSVSQFDYEIDSDKYAERSLIIATKNNQQFRTISFSEIRFNPFIYNFKSNSLKVITKAEISITTPQAKREVDSFDSLEKGFIAKTILPKRIYTAEKSREEVHYSDFSMANHWYKIEIDTDGVYSLSYNNLRNIIPVDDVDPTNFRIYSSGGKLLNEKSIDAGNPFQEIPLLVTGDTDGSFDSGDKIIFYARDRNDYDYTVKMSRKISINPFSNKGVYWLTFDSTEESLPLRIIQQTDWEEDIVTRDNNPQNSRYEREMYKRMQTNLYWYSNFLTGSSNSTYSYNLDASDIWQGEDNSYNSISAVFIQEYINSSSFTYHHVDIAFNGEMVVDDASWSGSSYRTVSGEGITPINGDNQIHLTINRTSEDNLYLDYLELKYLKNNIKHSNKQLALNFRNDDLDKGVRYEVSGTLPSSIKVFQTDDIYNVKLLPYTIADSKLEFVGTVENDAPNKEEYFVSKFYVIDNEFLTVASVKEVTPRDIAQEALNSESIIIAPSEFEAQAYRLKNIYTDSYGSSTTVVLQSQVFDQFNGGMDEPAAIRNFLRYLYNNSSRTPLKYVTLLGSGTYDWRNNKPASEGKNRIITYQSGNLNIGNAVSSDDYFVYLTQSGRPDVAIGRYPVRTASQLDLMIDNFEEYTNKEFDIDWWRNTGLFVADDFKNSTAIYEYFHTTELVQALYEIPKSVIDKRIYAYTYEADELGMKPNTRADIIEGINDGALVFYYAGHGGYDKLGTESFFRQGVDTALLTNDDRRTLFISAACDVSQYDSPDFNCLSSDILFNPNGGAIASLGSTRLCFSAPNNKFVGNLLFYVFEYREDIGSALLLAKARTGGSATNEEKYVLFGDPHTKIIPPKGSSTLTFEEDRTSFQARETVKFSGSFEGSQSATAKIMAFDTVTLAAIPDTVAIPSIGNVIFKGESSVTNGEYSSAFVVSDDIVDGQLGKILAYSYDESTKEEYLDSVYPVGFAGHEYFAPNESAPEISIWLESYDFREGDTVSQNPTLFAQIEDSNGINILGSTGHKILLIVDDDYNSIDVSNHFSFDIDSYQKGSLEYQINDLSEGKHLLKILAFDSFNRPSVKTVEFNVSSTSSIALTNVLPYPNPMSKKGGHFTFIVNKDSQISIDIYTITGKKIRTLTSQVTKGFNKISWNGRDKSGDRIANNTYFYVIKANIDGKTVSKREKFIIMD